MSFTLSAAKERSPSRTHRSGEVSHRATMCGALVAACLALFPLAPAAAQTETVSIQTNTGEVSVPENPQTIVVFDMAVIDTLDALGVKIAGVPTAPYPDYLAAYSSEETEKVGSLFEPDMEAVAALEPDLIITGGRSSAKTEALSQIAPTIDMSVDQADFLESSVDRIEALATIFGKEDAAKAKIDALRTSIGELDTQAANKGTGLLVLTTGGKISAFGPGSRFGILHSAFGVKPADSGLETGNHGEAVSFEYIAKTNPDWLFVLDRDAAIGRGAAASLLKNELVANTKAWKSDRVVYLNPTWYLSSNGLQALQMNADQIAAAFAEKS